MNKNRRLNRLLMQIDFPSMTRANFRFRFDVRADARGAQSNAFRQRDAPTRRVIGGIQSGCVCIDDASSLCNAIEQQEQAAMCDGRATDVVVAVMQIGAVRPARSNFWPECSKLRKGPQRLVIARGITCQTEITSSREFPVGQTS